ncbi:hypothetical protein CALCODRAFT_489127 [Calocera cornea HHB12733]|uniref:Uncharacterized protein n=1 Tax=Calocera cornea HHB12733 TaxID=1353952 RepID=A0A166JMA3_9BASI|nr:hypothetical protein CALCODRAFT_489127 [Calocera cornea HHB12733]
MKTQANVKLAADIKEGTQRMAAERLRKKARAGTPVPETMDNFPAPGTDLALQEHPQPISKTASFLTSITALPNPLPRQAPVMAPMPQEHAEADITMTDAADPGPESPLPQVQAVVDELVHQMQLAKPQGLVAVPPPPPSSLALLDVDGQVDTDSLPDSSDEEVDPPSSRQRPIPLQVPPKPPAKGLEADLARIHARNVAAVAARKEQEAREHAEHIAQQDKLRREQAELKDKLAKEQLAAVMPHVRAALATPASPPQDVPAGLKSIVKGKEDFAELRRISEQNANQTPEERQAADQKRAQRRKTLAKADAEEKQEQLRLAAERQRAQARMSTVLALNDTIGGSAQMPLGWLDSIAATPQRAHTAPGTTATAAVASTQRHPPRATTTGAPSTRTQGNHRAGTPQAMSPAPVMSTPVPHITEGQSLSPAISAPTPTGREGDADVLMEDGNDDIWDQLLM